MNQAFVAITAAICIICGIVFYQPVHNIWLAAGLPLGFTLFAWYKQALTAGGAAAASILGALIWYAGGIPLALPILTFFITGTLLSKLNKKTVASDAKQSKPRDAWQVICNGGVSGICCILFVVTKNESWAWLSHVSVAVSMADTWSSETGMRFGGRTINIIGFRPVQKGLSGGVSWQGTVGGLIGACFFSVSGLLFWQLSVCCRAGLLGFAGMLLDSVLGSLFQAKYQVQQMGGNPILSDLPPPASGAQPAGGFSWVTNDFVNLSANIIITAAAASWVFAGSS